MRPSAAAGGLLVALYTPATSGPCRSCATAVFLAMIYTPRTARLRPLDGRRVVPAARGADRRDRRGEVAGSPPGRRASGAGVARQPEPLRLVAPCACRWPVGPGSTFDSVSRCCCVVLYSSPCRALGRVGCRSSGCRDRGDHVDGISCSGPWPHAGCRARRHPRGPAPGPVHDRHRTGDVRRARPARNRRGARPVVFLGVRVVPWAYQEAPAGLAYVVLFPADRRGLRAQLRPKLGARRRGRPARSEPPPARCCAASPCRWQRQASAQGRPWSCSPA